LFFYWIYSKEPSVCAPDVPISVAADAIFLLLATIVVHALLLFSKRMLKLVSIHDRLQYIIRYYEKELKI
jgi:hypothetical protein